MANAASRVGIRELKAHLSQVVQRASAGQRFAVTDHGRVVAELGPGGSNRVPRPPCAR